MTLAVENKPEVQALSQIINDAWASVNASELGPIIRDVEMPSDVDETWKQSHERISILNMAAYETYKMVLESLLYKSRETNQ